MRRAHKTGQRVGALCSLDSSLDLKYGDPPLESRVEAFNPTTCEFLVETGNPGPSAPERVDVQNDDGSGLAESVAGTSSGRTSDVALGMPELVALGMPELSVEAGLPQPPLVNAASSLAKAYGKTYYHDPPHLTLNTQYNDIEWDFDGSCVNSYTTSSNTWSDGWWSGWAWDWHYFWQGDNSSKGACATYAYSAGRSHHRNHNFCFPQALWDPTEVHYDPNEIRGHASGGITHLSTSWVHGACGSWLHGHTEAAYLK